MIGSARKDLAEQFFDLRLIGRQRVAPSFEYCRRQHRGDADPRPDGSWSQLQRSCEGRLRLLQARRRAWPIEPRPAAHHQIARVGIGPTFSPDLPVHILDELEIQGMRETAADLLLRLGEALPASLDPLSPEVPAALGVDQLHVHPRLAARPPHATFEHIPDAELAAHLPYVDRSALVGQGGAASDDKAAGDP